MVLSFGNNNFKAGFNFSYPRNRISNVTLPLQEESKQPGVEEKKKEEKPGNPGCTPDLISPLPPLKIIFHPRERFLFKNFQSTSWQQQQHSAASSTAAIYTFQKLKDMQYPELVEAPCKNDSPSTPHFRYHQNSNGEKKNEKRCI
ncbi:hypothetical protein CDAR_585721 [Caerostris darwini]|uniref:Uncharacterized protein n=1 Tax=Caerostris darwini TaxID=1538125 RepID=A0AAV4TMM6_9ARAC|nr:hypothetical protein CDAR_585721 [Caerostris darwini]